MGTEKSGGDPVMRGLLRALHLRKFLLSTMLTFCTQLLCLVLSPFWAECIPFHRAHYGRGDLYGKTGDGPA